MYRRISLALITICFVALLVLLPAVVPSNQFSEGFGGKFVYVILQFFIFAFIYLGWFIAFYHRGSGAGGRLRYLLGTLLIAISVFLSAYLVNTSLDSQMSSKTENNLNALAFLIALALFIWLGLQWKKVKLESGEMVTEPTPNIVSDTMESIGEVVKSIKPEKKFRSETVPKHISDTVFTQQIDNAVTINGRGKQISDAVSLETGRYKIAYHLYRIDENDSLDITIVNADDVEAEDENILYEHGVIGSEIFTIKSAGRYILTIEGSSWDNQHPAWEVKINRI